MIRPWLRSTRRLIFYPKFIPGIPLRFRIFSKIKPEENGSSTISSSISQEIPQQMLSGFTEIQILLQAWKYSSDSCMNSSKKHFCYIHQGFLYEIRALSTDFCKQFLKVFFYGFLQRFPLDFYFLLTLHYFSRNPSKNSTRNLSNCCRNISKDSTVNSLENLFCYKSFWSYEKYCYWDSLMNSSINISKNV